MNDTEARFMRIKRLGEDDLAALHAAETAADIRWRQNRDNPNDRGDGWEIAGAQKLVALELALPPFWSQRTPEDERARAVKRFVDSPPVRRAFRMLEQEGKTECEATHEADWVVWKLADQVGTTMADTVRRA